MGELFSSGIPITQSGYKTLYKTFRWSPPAPDFAPEAADPRGKFRPGMVPSKTLSYRVYTQLVVSTTSTQNVLSSQVGNPLGGGLVSLFVQASVQSDVAFATGIARASVLLFEGHDVIDIPTDDMPFEDGVLTLPGNPFRLIHAGESTLVPDNDTKGVAYWAALAYHGNLDGNVLAGSAITEDAPFDVKQAVDPQGAKFVDTASNKVRINGDKPRFISYVEIDKPIFRDVVVTKSSVQAFGFNNPLSGFLLDGTALLGPPETYVLRFAFVNVSQDPDTTRFQWRLAESMGIKPDSIEQTPADLQGLLTDAEKAELAISTATNHFAYDLSDLESDDTTEANNFSAYKPLKKAYNTAYAKAKQDPGNKYFDKNFKATIFDQATGLGQGSGLTTGLAVAPFGRGGAGFSGSLSTEFMYTSPSMITNSSGKARIGTEYNGQIFGGRFLGGSTDFWLLAKTIESKSGMSCTYDPCMKNAYLYDVVSFSQGSTAVERTLDDLRWATGFEKRPSQDDGMLLGEYPFRSEGAAILLPDQVQIEADITEDGIVMPAQKFATNALFETGPSPSEPAGLFSSQSLEGDPVFQASLISAEEGTVLIGLPPTSFGGFKPGGGFASISELFGVGVGDVLLEAMPGVETTGDKSTDQIATIGELKWPIPISNTSVAMDCTTGYFFLAFEDDDRVDIAFKTSYGAPFGIIRDVILRIPDDEDAQNNNRPRRTDTRETKASSDASDLPPATLPYLVTDGPAKVLYLFYSYKGKLLCKKIAYEILVPTKSNLDNKYDLSKEAEIAGKVHGIAPSLVFDPSANAPSSDGQSQSLAADIRAGAVRVIEDPTATKPAQGESRSMDQYSVILDRQGYLFAFVQSGGKIVIRRSLDMGDTWTNILPSGFSFIPGKDMGDLEAPFVMYDSTQDVILLFYVLNGTLLFQRLSANILRKEPDVIAGALILVPKALFGSITKQMVDNGVVPTLSIFAGLANDGKAVPAQRLAGYITSTGQYRVFLKDSDGLLLSLISSNSGEEWLSETEYEMSREGLLNSLQFFESPESFKQSISSGDNG